MRAPRIPIKYSEYELVWIEVRKDLPRRELHAQFVATFGRDDVTFENLHALCKRKGWHTGRTGRFEAGSEPWSKGRKIGSHPNAARTQFKKGQTTHNRKGAGHEYLGKDGYVFLILEGPHPTIPGRTTYPVLKHRHLWEQANGPIPDGHVLKCLGDDKSNCDPANWELVPMGMIPRLAGRKDRNRLGYDAAPAELKPTLMAVAKLEHRAREIRRKKEEV